MYTFKSAFERIVWPRDTEKIQLDKEGKSGFEDILTELNSHDSWCFSSVCFWHALKPSGL